VDKRQHRFLADVPRLLRAKEQFRSLSSIDAASSIPAFLAWKAFLIVARQESAPTEKRRCQDSVAETLKAFPDEVMGPTREFVENLQLLRNPRMASPSVVEDWFISMDDLTSLQRDQLTIQRERILRSIERLDRALQGDGRLLLNEGDAIGEQLYRVRNSVIGHASVVTGMVLFDRIVPAFESLVSELALLGRARLGNISAYDARAEIASATYG
jgi:hypothetical protein